MDKLIKTIKQAGGVMSRRFNELVDMALNFYQLVDLLTFEFRRHANHELRLDNITTKGQVRKVGA